MAIELHVWGPAFGLPSIDATCLASIALLQNSLPKGSWTLVPATNPASNPFGELPALRHGQLWIAGFKNISQYLGSEIERARYLDADLTDLELADCAAFSSFLEARGLPLLDLSLYVSSDNYTNRTRGALAEILDWPQSWTIPHQLRDRAKNRSSHLGLSGLDVDAVREKQLKNENEGISGQIPKSLRKPRQTVSALLGSSAQQTRFRLEGVSDDFFEPLANKLGENKWLLGDNITTLDCLAIGLLAQMLLTDLPQPWLSEQMAQKHPSLDRWAKQHVTSMFGPAVNVQAIMRGQFEAKTHLPWQKSTSRSWQGLVADLLNTTIGSIPYVNTVPEITSDRNFVRQQQGGTGKFERKQLMHSKRQRQQLMRQQLVAACLSSMSIVGWLMYTGLIPVPKRQPGPMRHDFGAIRRSFGEAGSFLGLG